RLFAPVESRLSARLRPRTRQRRAEGGTRLPGALRGKPRCGPGAARAPGQRGVGRPGACAARLERVPVRGLMGRPPPMALERLNRRSLLCRASAFATAGGLGLYRNLSIAAALNAGHPLAPKAGHFPSKAK